MSEMSIWLAGVFLPLFPLSMVFNFAFARLRNPAVRIAFLLAWPQLGLSLLAASGTSQPAWVLPLALFTAVLYAFRAISLRDVGQWVGYLATSSWALAWLAMSGHIDQGHVHFFVLSFSVPLAVLVMLGAHLERGFGAAYAGLYGGLAHTLPRLSGILVLVVLAAVATPLFPAFFVMTSALVDISATAPLSALVVAVTWLLWSWAGVRLLQGFIVGSGDRVEVRDISVTLTWAYAGILIVLLIGGFYLAGDVL